MNMNFVENVVTKYFEKEAAELKKSNFRKFQKNLVTLFTFQITGNDPINE